MLIIYSLINIYYHSYFLFFYLILYFYYTVTGKNLTVKTLTEPDFIKHLELAIQFGNPFLFENVDEELDPLLDPVLEKSVVKEGNGSVIKLGMEVLCFLSYFFLGCHIVSQPVISKYYLSYGARTYEQCT